MPEGDTVLQTAARLHAALAGQVLTHSDLRVPRFATADLTGRTVLDVTARGKHLLTRVEGGLTLHSHLRMDGAWRIYAPGERWRGGPAHQIRAVLATADHTAVGYRLPVLELLRTSDEEQGRRPSRARSAGPGLGPRHRRGTPARRPGPPPRRGPPGPAQPRRHRQCLQVRAVLPGPRHPLAPRRRPPRRNRSPGWSPRPTASSTPTATAPPARPPSGRAPPRPGTPPPTRTGAAASGCRSPSTSTAGRHRPCLRCGTPIRKADQEDRPTYWCPRCQSGPTP